jgi:hypothetical protein
MPHNSCTRMRSHTHLVTCLEVDHITHYDVADGNWHVTSITKHTHPDHGIGVRSQCTELQLLVVVVGGCHKRYLCEANQRGEHESSTPRLNPGRNVPHPKQIQLDVHSGKWVLRGWKEGSGSGRKGSGKGGGGQQKQRTTLIGCAPRHPTSKMAITMATPSIQPSSG